ncbi:MAG: putative Serine/threonine-protein kinase 3 [Streblomastix strix]|uniref:non-specific serine/threonine protein kinase n=1 Tax=Streblomastix strix TaxID=222440 RepID=A0A5J4V6J9_9EUKA|nr:MAG: putative Serine/threonine-protein kinase 3 [Streblomastix strix]
MSIKISPKSVEEAYEIVSEIGKGTYGKVYKAICKEDKKPRALKEIKIQSLDELHSIANEISIMQKCKHKNIVRYYETLRYGENCIVIAMEICEGGSLMSLFDKSHIGLDEEQLSFAVKEVLKGLSFLHKKKVIHRDIKAGNILITANGDIKLADFGVSASLKMTVDNRKTAIGSPYWMAPEVIQQEEYSFQADIWSLGITAIELATGRPPLADIHAFRAIFMIPTRPSPKLGEIAGKHPSPELEDFLASCFVKNPAKRASCDELLRVAPFLKEM